MDLWLACYEFKSSTAEEPPCRGAMHVKYVESSNIPPLTKQSRFGTSHSRPDNDLSSSSLSDDSSFRQHNSVPAGNDLK
ncbi:hypothetical protein TNCV_802491 [Trichonephila clavipes]|nr:hypothetical protein TNCV_802491 [Trichonephila clavipes]